MKKYTQQEAIHEIFSSKLLPPKLLVYKHRYNNGKLSHKAVDEILKAHGFMVISDAIYVK